MPKIQTVERKQMMNFEPILTHHALQRISVRIQKGRSRQASIIVGNYLITGDIYAKWLSPALIRHILADVKSSIFDNTYYHPKRGLITQGKLAWYALSQQGEVMTVMTELTSELKKESRNVDFRFRAMYLNLDIKNYCKVNK